MIALMLLYVESEESGCRQVVLEAEMMFEELSEGHATAAGDRTKGW